MDKYTSIIDCQTVADHIGNDHLIIIDTRFNLKDIAWGRDAYANGHIPGALYAHLDHDLSSEIISGVTGRHPWPAVEQVRALFASWGVTEDSQIVVYDQSHGGIAARVWAMARYVGIESVSVLDGGWKAWQNLGLPESTEVQTPKKSDLRLKLSLLQIIDVDEIKSVSQLIDARASERYQGLEEPIDPIAGHIPGAINFPFLDNLTEAHLWKSKDEIKARFSSLASSDGVGVYCGSGVTACHNLLAFEYAGIDVSAKLYPGSWSHYITDAGREVRLGEA